jgi:RNA polymerase sigma factor (sigma-70 family)
VSLPPFEQIVETHGPAVLRFCVGRLGPERAEDVFQETMLAALRAYADLRDAGAIRSWLFSIAARKTIDAHRAASRAPTPVEDVEEVAGGTAEAPSLDGAIWAKVRALPEKQRQAVGLRFLADLSYREIGEAMGTSEPAARRNVFEALRRLREEERRGADLTFGRRAPSNDHED